MMLAQDEAIGLQIVHRLVQMLLLRIGDVIGRAQLRPLSPRRLHAHLLAEESEALRQHELKSRFEQRIELTGEGARGVFAHSQDAGVSRTARLTDFDQLRAEDDAIRIDSAAQVRTHQRHPALIGCHDPLYQLHRLAELQAIELIKAEQPGIHAPEQLFGIP